MALKPIRSVRFLTDYEDQSTDLVIPEDLTTLGDEELATLSTQATEAFNTIYSGGQADLSEEDLATLSVLADGIEALRAETATRETAAADRAARAAELAATVAPEAPEADAEEEADEADSEDEADEDGDETDSEDEADAEEQPESVTASSRRDIRVNVSALRGRTRTPAPDAPSTPTIRDIAFASTEAGGYAVGTGMDFSDMGAVVDRRLATFNAKQYASAAKAGRRRREQFGIATIQKPHGDMLIRSDSPEEIERVLNLATDQTRLKGNSLVAAGGWCAPSETIYDIYDCGEQAADLLSIPTVGMSRGGIRFNKGVGFNDLMTQTGFFYTEQQDIDGNYGTDEDGVGDGTEGSKPCFHIPCIEFEEVRLDLDGLCLTAGLLQSRGYPEVIADTIRKALIAHEIRMDSRTIAEIVAGSTAVALPEDQVGATAPILSAIELQAQHYRSSGSLGDSTVLEGVFPVWVKGAIRSDLSRRLGVDLLSVPDSRIMQWFADRKIAAQFVANWQNVGTTAASGFTSWPTEVDFLLYKAGTWVRGNSDVITLENVYDSTLLGSNDYTALFTEEGIATFMRGCDSRVVTVPICPSGETGAGVGIDCTGVASA